MNYRKLSPHVFLILSAMIYGANFSIARYAMPEYVKPFGFIVLRCFVVMVLFQVLGLFFKREKIDKKDWSILLLCGAFGIAFNQLLLFYGLSLTSPISASTIMTTIPIFITLLSIVFLKIKVSLTNVIGLIVGFFGAFLLIIYGKQDFYIATHPILGNTLILMASGSFSIYFIMIKRLVEKYSQITILKFLYTFGFLLSLPFGYEQIREIAWKDLPLSAIFSVVYSIIAVSCLAYWFNLLALKQLDAHIAGIYTYIEPVFATFFAVLLSKDSLDLIKITCALLVFSGVYFVTQRKKRLEKAV